MSEILTSFNYAGLLNKICALLNLITHSVSNIDILGYFIYLDF